ncbi:ABC transporter substrate-binding protein [Thiomicrorhabdus sediminis]|uniref:Thiamine pyrimidine synthase n=1 Tax=Thiomicrorhabdus sediminis TaxID=2580412 RepID=A0A4V1HHK4_9GAMM|nr:ABC transporter substrate-binding protein [Thiomicrorhabdus sediminis]QCU89333.1 PAS domain S-box protein [Thiomicrorhabdus sediminis]
MKNLLFVLVLLFSSQAIAGFDLGNKETKKTVTVQLKWQHQFQFAGYYMAKAKGFYKAHGLDVKFKLPEAGVNPIQQVLKGYADFGIGTSELLLEYAKGQPILVLGVIFQHSPLALVSLKRPDIDVITDLAGKKLMIEENSSEIYALLQQSGLHSDDFQYIQHDFSINSLMDGSVDAQTVYTTTEPYAMSRSGIQYQTFSPRMAGIDFYGDNFFTTQNLAHKDPQTVTAFRSATIEGWRYAMQHIDETINHILSHYSTDRSRDALTFEAEAMQKLMRIDLIEPGHMSRYRWKHIASVYQDIGLLKSTPNLDKFIYQEQNIIDNYTTELQYLLAFLIGTLVVLLASAYLTQRFFRLQTQLSTMIDQSPIAVMLLNEQFEIMEWNLQAEKTFGWRASQTINHNIFDFLVIEPHKPRVQQNLLSVLDSQQPIQIENKNYTITGQEITCHWSNAPFHINGEKFIICMAVDVSELRSLKALTMEKAVFVSDNSITNEEFLQRLVNTMQLCLQIWEESTSKSKVQFAEDSGLWRVSLDGSTAKTRTLDKYLSTSSIPQKPRWKQVINTANFILREFPNHPKCQLLNEYKQSIRKPED